MLDEFEWSRSTLFGALTVRMLVAGALSPITGRLADTERWPKLMMVAGGTIFAASLMAVSLVQTVTQYLLIFGVAGGVGTAAGSGLIRQAVVAKWFVRKRGRAMAVGTMGMGMGAFIYPVVTFALIQALGWRTAWVIVGLAAWVQLVPFALLTIRQPEDVGLLPDGDTPEEVAARRAARESGQARNSRPDASEEYSYTLREAVRTKTVWLLATSTTFIGFTVGGGFATTWVPRFQDVGIDPAIAATALATYGAGSVLSRFVWGYFADRYHVRSVLIVQMLLTSMMVIFMLQVRSAPIALIWSGFQGVIWGGYIGLNPLILPNYFGRQHIGTIRGAFTPLRSAAAAAGPLAIAWMFDITGSYDRPYFFVFVVWLLGALFMYLAKPVKPPERTTASVPGPAQGG
jgi:MFS family permease